MTTNRPPVVIKPNLGCALVFVFILFAMFSCVGEPDLYDAMVARVGGTKLGACR